VREFWSFTNHDYVEVMLGNRLSRREPEIGFWEIATDLLQARLWPTFGLLN